MKTSLRLPFFVALFAAAGFCQTGWAQLSSPVPPQPAPLSQGEGQTRSDQKIEHLHHSDSGSTIDELRVGGEAQSITVKPAYNVPAYQVVPEKTTPNTNSGQRMWKLFDF